MLFCFSIYVSQLTTPTPASTFLSSQPRPAISSTLSAPTDVFIVQSPPTTSVTSPRLSVQIVAASSALRFPSP